MNALQLLCLFNNDPTLMIRRNVFLLRCEECRIILILWRGQTAKAKCGVLETALFCSVKSAISCAETCHAYLWTYPFPIQVEFVDHDLFPFRAGCVCHLSFFDNLRELRMRMCRAELFEMNLTSMMEF